MKILQIIYRFYPSVGGSQNHVLNLSRALINRGHKVIVVTTTSLNNIDIRGFSTGRKFTLKSTNNKLKPTEKYENIEIIRFKPIFQLWTYLINPRLFFYLLKNIYKFDIVHVHCYQTSEPDIVKIVSILKNKKFILTAHDIITPFKGIGGFIKKIYDNTLGNLLLHKAKYLIALTEENKKQYLELGNFIEKIKIIPNGIDFNRIYDVKTVSRKKNRYQVLFVGRIMQYKGIQYIIESIPKILKFTKDIKFIFVGEDQGYKKSLLKKVFELKAENYCKFTGKINDDELTTYYKNSDIFILPSKGEGFGITVLEAIAGGSYPILANSGGLKYLLKNIGGLPLNMNDNISQQISRGVINILTNYNKKRSEIIKMQKIIKNKYNWDSITKKTEDIYLAIDK